MTSMTYREFVAELDRVGGQLRELTDRTTAESLAALSDDAFAEECAHFVYLSNKLKRLGAAFERKA
jgi:hypothetical protein